MQLKLIRYKVFVKCSRLIFVYSRYGVLNVIRTLTYQYSALNKDSTKSNRSVITRTFSIQTIQNELIIVGTKFVALVILVNFRVESVQSR